MSSEETLADQRSDRRAAIGREVAARLSRRGAAERVDTDKLEMFIRPGFLNDAECAALIAMIDADRQPSTLFSEEGDYAGHRTSESCNLDRWNPTVEGIDRRICALLGLKARQGETLQGQRYAVGQQFRPHHDFFHTDQPYWEEQRKFGGQRTWTAMIFLNEPDAGGETGFPAAGLVVEPRTGMLLAWNNMAADGRPNPATLHEGTPVAAGVKYIVTKWFRERNWF